MKLTTAQLQSFMLNERPPEMLDLSDKRQFYKQQVTTTDLNQALKSVMDTELLFAFSREGFNSKEMLQLPLLRNLLKDVSKQTKQSFEELIKQLKLSGFVKRLNELGFDSRTYLRNLKKNETKGSHKNMSSSTV